MPRTNGDLTQPSSESMIPFLVGRYGGLQMEHPPAARVLANVLPYPTPRRCLFRPRRNVGRLRDELVRRLECLRRCQRRPRSADGLCFVGRGRDSAESIEGRRDPPGVRAETPGKHPGAGNPRRHSRHVTAGSAEAHSETPEFGLETPAPSARTANGCGEGHPQWVPRWGFSGGISKSEGARRRRDVTVG